MKKRNVVLQAAVAATFVSAFGVAQAGTIAAGSISYAVEGVAAATVLTLAPVAYNLGVGRTTTQPFTMIYTLSGTSTPTFSVTPAVPTASGNACAIVGSSLKRGGAGASQVVYDIVVSGNCVAGDVITMAAPSVTAATASVSMSVQLLDTGETACVDNVGTPSTCTVGPSTRATLTAGSGFGAPAALAAPTSDTTTVVDVNAAVPLAGFLAAVTVPANSSDTGTVARAVLAITNTVTNVKNAANTGDFTLAAGDLITLTLSDVTGFLGLATNGLCYDKDASAVTNGTTTPCAAGEVFTVSGNTATLAGIAGTSAGITGANAGVGQTVSYTADAVTQMGTSRSIDVGGSVTPTASGGAARAFVGKTAWWTWTSNGTILQAPLFQNAAGFLSRFALTNTGTSPATYTAVIRTEAGNTCTLGPGATGSIPANGLVVVDAFTICTGFTSGQPPRGAAIFTVNAPTNNIQGMQQNVGPGPAFAVSSVVMKRPGSN